jgi:hypothetical protein
LFVTLLNRRRLGFFLHDKRIKPFDIGKILTDCQINVAQREDWKAIGDLFGRRPVSVGMNDGAERDARGRNPQCADFILCDH